MNKNCYIISFKIFNDKKYLISTKRLLENAQLKIVKFDLGSGSGQIVSILPLLKIWANDQTLKSEFD